MCADILGCALFFVKCEIPTSLYTNVSRMFNGLIPWQAPSSEMPVVPYRVNKYNFVIDFVFGFKGMNTNWMHECVPYWMEFDFCYCLMFLGILEAFIGSDNFRTFIILDSTSGHLTHRSHSDRTWKDRVIELFRRKSLCLGRIIQMTNPFLVFIYGWADNNLLRPMWGLDFK